MTVTPTAASVPVPGRCPRLVGITWTRQGRILGWLRPPVDQPVACGIRLELVPHKLRVQCPACARHAKKYTEREVTIARPPTTLHTLTGRQKARLQATAARRWFNVRKGAA